MKILLFSLRKSEMTGAQVENEEYEMEDLIRWYMMSKGKNNVEKTESKSMSPKLVGRSFAFKVFSRKEEMDRYLYKTKLCRSVLKKEECIHGRNCRFAHSTSELVPRHCLFQNSCRYVEKNDRGEYENAGGKASKKCFYLHPDETMDNFQRRTGKTSPCDEDKVVTILTLA